MLALMLALACGHADSTAARPAAGTTAAGALAVPAPASAGRLRIEGTRFVNADGTPFTWRGITAFRLLEYVAHDREAEAAAYLDWARAHDITVVRVLTMATHLFELTPEEGLSALPRLLTLAAERSMHVEVVALADTAIYDIDLDAHVEAVGHIVAAHSNALLELANEPYHSSQRHALGDRSTLERLAARVPDGVLVAWGADEPTRSGGGDYVTVHLPRGGDPWQHVRALAEGVDLVARYGRPVVSDEPIGAGPRFVRDRRDDSPERFRAQALLTRMTGMYATFHYEGGLQARVPEGRELEALNAWREAWALLPEDIERGHFTSREAGQWVIYETQLDDRGYGLVVPSSSAAAPDLPVPYPHLPELTGYSPISSWDSSSLWRR